MDTLKTSDIAAFLKRSLTGPDIAIEQPCSLSNPQANSVAFLKLGYKGSFDMPENMLLIMDAREGNLDRVSGLTHIKSPTPKLDFARVLTEYFPPEDTQLNTIGIGTIIEPGAIVTNAVIGNNCLIKSGAVIGRKGFNFIKDEEGHPFPMPHGGKVIIGDNVEVGSNVTVARGVLDDTVIADYVKLDDHVHVAHNVAIGENTMITAHVEISGSVTIGKNVWIAPRTCILNHVTIGDNVTIYIGSVVGKNVAANKTVFGYPARPV